MGELYIGLMSGTSMDGIDAALVEFGDSTIRIHQAANYPYPAALREQLLAAIAVPLDREIPGVAELDRATGECFRDAALALLREARVDAGDVTAIGSHGQTLRHQPNAENPFTLQIAAPSVIASGTGILTIADFRSADIAAGGQGAPLAPIFHEWLFRSPGVDRVVVNIGGIANVTLLTARNATTGFDTGPGNTLMDAWVRRHHDEAFDQDGRWARSGKVNEELLRRLLQDPYFAAAPPKSTGFEAFNLRWLESATKRGIAAADVQATLCELTARTISAAIAEFAPASKEILVCGGGVHNGTLLHRLGECLQPRTVCSTAVAGLDPDWVEAAAFAWLARRRLQGLPGNLPSVTGAREAVVMGTVHRPR